MNILADAVIDAILYISTAQAENDERMDDDVRVLESLTATLHQCSAAEREALRASLNRARTAAESAGHVDPDLFDTFRAIETGLLNDELPEA